MEFNKAFWSERYEKNLVGWDAGAITTPIKEYADQIPDKEIEILIPGCGNGHEAVYLHDQGFKNVYVIDLVDEPINDLRKRCNKWQPEQFIVGDFFDHQGNYDLVLEQTFFCAVDPVLRQKYADKVFDLLKPGGKLIGLLFTFPLTEQGPPFGGSQEEYLKYFNRYEIRTMEVAHNSIKPRMGNELFINLVKPG